MPQCRGNDGGEVGENGWVEECPHRSRGGEGGCDRVLREEGRKPGKGITFEQ